MSWYSFNNRFNKLTYNNTQQQYREKSVYPFTNNSDLDIENSYKTNIYNTFYIKL